jgi:hypothetical protein
MATNVLRGKSRGTKPQPDKGLAIGETDARVFNCPACARPLSNGTWRCTGCGVHLVMGVTLRRALAILILGMVLGMPIGVVTTVSAVTLSLPGPPAAIVPIASPSATPSSAPTPSPTPVVVTVPSTAISALSGTTVVNGRISVDAASLAAMLKKKGVSTIEIARALRSLAADAALGTDLTSRLSPWAAANEVQVMLDTFYQSMAETAKTGLRASLTDAAAYRKAAAAMLVVVQDLGAVDAASRELAGTEGIELPPIAIPES